MLTSTDFQGLIGPRFFKNFFPIPATNPMEYGMTPPDFELPNITQGGHWRLSACWGDRPVVLDFTRIFTEKQYCPLCYPHLQALSKAHEQFQQRNVELVLITSTDEHQSQIVARDLNLKMPLLSDPDCRVFRAYALGQALGAPLPAQFVLDQEGQLQFKHLFSFLSPNASVDRLLSVVDRLGALAGAK